MTKKLSEFYLNLHYTIFLNLAKEGCMESEKERIIEMLTNAAVIITVLIVAGMLFSSVLENNRANSYRECVSSTSLKDRSLSDIENLCSGDNL